MIRFTFAGLRLHPTPTDFHTQTASFTFTFVNETVNTKDL
jgi:hypothetical protein